MKIALIGYGKMGQAIEELAKTKGHTVDLIIDIQNREEAFTEANFKNIDVAIEFTSPHSAVENIKRCLQFGVPVISGSTGWTEKWEEVINYCKEMNGSFLWASNFSIGVNIFFELNKYLAKMMGDKTDYNVTLEEIHHTQKKDSPSGTAITLAEGVLQSSDTKKNWINEFTDDNSLLSIISKRIDPTPGTHSITYTSDIDDIEIIHTAHNRKGFASGAIFAAEFIKEKKGVYSMKDVLNL